MKLKCNFLINTVAGDQIAVPVGKNPPFRGYIKLNETAKEIFEVLKHDTTREEIVSKMVAKYPDANIKDIEHSVDNIVDKLNSSGLLI